MQTRLYYCFLLLTCAVWNAHVSYAGEANPGATNTISWEEFKYRCSDSRDKPLNQQGKPEHVRVQCTNVEREFVPGEPGVMQLDASRQVMTTIVSDKFDVSAMSRDYPTSVSSRAQGSCLRYKEVERTIQVEKNLGCAELLAIKGDINDYCASALDMVKGTSPKLIETHETGAVRDSCSAIAGGKNFE